LSAPPQHHPPARIRIQPQLVPPAPNLPTRTASIRQARRAVPLDLTRTAAARCSSAAAWMLLVLVRAAAFRLISARAPPRRFYLPLPVGAVPQRREGRTPTQSTSPLSRQPRVVRIRIPFPR